MYIKEDIIFECVFLMCLIVLYIIIFGMNWYDIGFIWGIGWVEENNIDICIWLLYIRVINGKVLEK